MIRGFAVGGGCELAVATDLRIASDDSKLGIPVGKLGISIGHREMRGLVNLVGKGNALYILLSARLLDAQESLRIGLVNQVVKPEDLHDYTHKLAGDIASLAPLSHAVNKLTMHQVQNKPSLEELTQEEADLPLTQFDTKDYQEGYKAFLEKRRPNFIGEYSTIGEWRAKRKQGCIDLMRVKVYTGIGNRAGEGLDVAARALFKHLIIGSFNAQIGTSEMHIHYDVPHIIGHIFE